MKKTLIISAFTLAAMTGMTLTATAQGLNPDPAANIPTIDCPHTAAKKAEKGQGPGNSQDERLSELNLTDAQKAKINDIRAQHWEETHAKLRAVLVPEQRAICDARKQEPNVRFENVMRELNLTDAQSAQFNDILAQHQKEAYAKICASLTPEQQTICNAHK
ncbi:MAG: hypothetical protein LBI16_06120 [Burkholderiales bacterium]|jgi:Spy/CpxP family protein refolding chaperone|nr:hypothetical protein [Burkholderiales bacterium]